MADPSFNLKTGADSQLYYSREVTASGNDKDKIITTEGVTHYPVLSRQTGNSVKGMTESITSNELRKGRTKSAPRKGNSSAEGSLDFELSPITYDDFFEAALRGRWTLWKGDYDSTNKALKEDVRGSNLGFASGDYCFATKCSYTKDTAKGFGKKKLFNFDGDNGYDDASKSFLIDSDVKGLFQIPKGSIIHELNCGTDDIKYMVLRQFGGVEGEDLFQKFDHMAVSTISNDISVGQIITGSVGFMGANDPKLLKTADIGGEFDKKGYSGTKGDDTSMFLDGVTTGNSLIANLPNMATQTDQFTAREGFLYLNGINIEFANAMNWTLDNGLQKYFAIFVRNAIATSPLSLDITGNITTYLIYNRSDDIYNAAVDDENNEILWCIEDNEDNPKYLYFFQIFKSKFTDHDASVNSSDALNVSFPFQSFGEQAIRVFRVTLPVSKVDLTWNTTSSKYEFTVHPMVALKTADIATMALTAKVGGTDVTITNPTTVNADGTITYVVDSGVAADDSVDVKFTVTYDASTSEDGWTGIIKAPAHA